MEIFFQTTSIKLPTLTNGGLEVNFPLVEGPGQDKVMPILMKEEHLTDLIWQGEVINWQKFTTQEMAVLSITINKWCLLVGNLEIATIQVEVTNSKSYNKIKTTTYI